MAKHRMGPPPELVLALRDAGGTNRFIESGTYLGDTAAWAADQFPEVVTIELSPEHHAAAVTRFSRSPHVAVLHGRSEVVLSTLDLETGPALFWLDAHWSGGATAGRNSECPLLEELAVINGSPADHVVLVDDGRLFCAPPPRPHRADQWPTLIEVVSALSCDGRRHVVLWDDVFLAVPVRLRRFLVEWLQDHSGPKAAPKRSWRGRIFRR